MNLNAGWIAKSFLQNLKQINFNNLKIRTKITLFYLLLLIFSISISNLLHQKIYASVTSRKVSEVSYQMLHLIEQNFNSIIDIVSGQSKMILANSDVQELLINSQRKAKDPDFIRRLNTSLYSYMEVTPVFTGIYLFDFDGFQYSIDKIQQKTLNIRNIKQAEWFPQVKEMKGAYLLIYNAGGIFWQQPAENNYMSLIRIVNDLETQAPIGVLVVNIPENVLINSFKEISNKYNTQIAIFDEYDREIVNYDKLKKINLPMVLQQFEGKFMGTMTEQMNGLGYLVSYMRLKRCNWKIISCMSFSELSDELKIFNLIAFILLLVNSLLLLAGSLFISRMITTPVNKLLSSMKMVEEGAFEKVSINKANDEIGHLQKGYNIMIDEIKALIERVIEEQRTKRKAELDVLQAQIKPHFLYNTFDAISALALAGRNEDVYTVMKALGGYYRASLSKGSEVISIAEEFELVKNYLIIQQFRYGDLFTIEYDLDPEVGKYKILKLILQPLVENAIYHGIKPKGEKGLIKLGAKLSGNRISLIVEDDGVGMNEAELERITTESVFKDSLGFGLRGTFERLRIFYGTEVSYRMETQKGNGMKIIIAVPCKE
jgi:two-component system sensor histidine kinase YesM